ncbi:MAG TPA: thiolase family protein, partial [Acidimicrobiia bacterium]|nr:thiolase family protein [Acidimicrobiia bacterium]
MTDQRGVVAGVGMTHFGKFLDRGLKSLAGEAVRDALADAGLEPADVQVAVVGNAVAGLITGQECIRGQVVLRDVGIGGIPIFNVENACASASSAFHLAWLQVAAGQVDVALALGVEKLTGPDKTKSFAAFGAAVDVELLEQVKAALRASASGGERRHDPGGEPKSSMFMDVYAAIVRAHLDRYGTTREQMAKVAVKNHRNGALNPRAQYRDVVSLDDVLASREISYPLTLLMCSPIGDGAAAAVVVSPSYARAHGLQGPKIAASVVTSGNLPDSTDEMSETRAARAAYEASGLGPRDIDIAEVHDATAPAEILAYEDLGFCARGEGGRLVDEGATEIGGRLPVNTSGGLSAKGHPVGATGLAQICEIVWQL